MNKKGFTLIELLAVIVILAIIALIATPIVLNIIKDTRESAGLRSAEMYLETVEQAVSIEKMNNTSFNPSTCTIKEDGNLNCEEINVQVEVKGEKPLKGNIVFESGKITEVRLEYKNNKIILKNEKGKLEYFDYNRNSDINFVVEGIKEQKTTTGKNLYSGGDVSGTQSVVWNYIKTIPAGSYTISANVESLDTDATSCLIIFYNDTTPVGSCFLNRGLRKSTKVTLSNDVNRMDTYASIGSGQAEGDTFSFTDIQIETGEIATEYEEYTGGKPSPSLEYPQEIPLTGTLNPKTGKYDINVTASTEDGSKTKALTLTSPVQLTKWDKLVKKDGVWGWSIWNSQFIFSQDKNFYVGGLWNDELSFSIYNAPKINNRNEGYSEMFIFLANPQTRTPQVEAIDWYENSLLVWLNKDRGLLDAESFNAYFSEKPIKIQYNTTEEQAFHPLPEEEQNLLYNLKL